MVRQGRSIKADSRASASRRQDAIAFCTVADRLLAEAQEGQKCNPIMTAYAYGAKIGRTADAQDKFQKLQRFAEWAEQQLTNAT